MKILLYFLLSRLVTQSVIHPSSIQQTFKHVFNTGHIICPSTSIDCKGMLELKPYLNGEMNWAAVTSHGGGNK